MPEFVINGPVIASGVHNVVLQDALFHSPKERRSSATDYYVIQIGIREGEFTSWVGTWSQNTQKVDGADPTSILDDGRPGMRLKANQAIVVKVTPTGTPATLSGSRINFRLARVGGRDGTAKPLVSSGVASADANTQTALATLERQVNKVAQWEESVQLVDPTELAPTGTFQGRLQVDSVTQISLQRFGGNWVEVDGSPVSLTSAGLPVTSTAEMLEATGAVGSTAPSSSTLYYVYLSQDGDLRLSATAPTRHLGLYYLGATAGTTTWRFCGWVYTDGSTQFVDAAATRHVVNYYNRLAKEILLQPGYSDNNGASSWTETSTSWTAANSGTGATAAFIGNGEDAIHLNAAATVANDGANVSGIAISTIASSASTDAESSAKTTSGTDTQSIHCSWAEVPSAGYQTVSLLCLVSGGTGTFFADLGRDGSAADVRNTYLVGIVQV